MKPRRPFYLVPCALLCLSWGLGFIPRSGLAEQRAENCPTAREIALKGVALFEVEPKKGLDAIQRAFDLCTNDLGIAFNLGLSRYLAGEKDKAREIWETLYQTTRESPPSDLLAMKTMTNLAWLRFEQGEDEEAHMLAFEGVKKYPGNMALAHTKLMSLFRMARYLEAYDWLVREELPGSRAREWKQQSADYIVEELWRQFRSGQHLASIRQAINFLVKEYPNEPTFVRAKEELLHAEVDPDAAIANPVDLPHEVWPKSGNMDDRSLELDPWIKTLGPLDTWIKRQDAFAVVVGISNYRHNTPRHYAARDAANFHDLLLRRGVFLNDADHLRLRLNQEATRDVMGQDLQWLAQKGRTNPNAILLFYFAGLGSPWTQGNDGLLLPVEADRRGLSPQSAVSLQWLKQLLEQLPNRHIMIILDTCFHRQGGCVIPTAVEADNPLSRELFSGPQEWAVASIQGSAGLFGPGRQGAFTYHLLKGLLGEADGLNGKAKDGWVTLSEAFGYTQARLQALGSSADPFLNPSAETRLTKTQGER